MIVMEQVMFMGFHETQLPCQFYLSESKSVRGKTTSTRRLHVSRALAFAKFAA